MGRKYKYKGRQKRHWWRWILASLAVVILATLVIDSGCKHYLKLSIGKHIPLFGYPLFPPVVAVNDSTDLWVLSYGFLDPLYDVVLAKRWSLGPEKIMEASSECHGDIEISRRSDGQFFALRYSDRIVDHHDMRGEHPGPGPQMYQTKTNLDSNITDEIRLYDKQVKEWLGPDYKVVWKSRYD